MVYGIPIISLLFFFVFAIYIYWGVRIISLSPRQRVNQAFFIHTVFLSVWSFGYAMVNFSTQAETALFWMRFMAVGKVMTISMTLHFIILLAKKNINEKLRKSLLFLHIPALIFVYIFAISPTLSRLHHSLVKVDYGWENATTSTLAFNLYLVYMLIYLVLSLLFVRQWKKDFNNKKVIRQANFFYATILSAFALGAFIDYHFFSSAGYNSPEITSVFILLPTWSLYHSARYYGTMDKERVYKVDTIVSEHDKRNIFMNLAVAFYIAALFSFIYEYVPNLKIQGSFSASMTKSLVIASIGIMIRITQNIKDLKLRDGLTIMILASSIPIVSFQFLDYGGITIWAFPMVIMFVSIVFSNLTLLISSTIIAIITQFLIWAFEPEVALVLDSYDYIFRIGLLLVAFFAGLYINRMYMAKSKENKYQVQFQKMVSDISFGFLSVKPSNFDKRVDDLLKEIGEFFHVDRTYLFTVDYDEHEIIYSHEWCGDGIPTERGRILPSPLDAYPWWMDQLNYKGLVRIEDVENMPEEAKAEQAALREQLVKSVVAVPVIENGKVQAFLGIDSVVNLMPWPEEKIAMLNIMANIVSSGISRVRTDQEIEHMAYFDALTQLPNRFLFEDRVNQAINISQRTGDTISVVFLDLDGFKSVNDSIGHNGGDILLQKISKGLSSAIRKTDTVARFGGDEFMILINNVSDSAKIELVVEKVMNVFSEPFVIKDQKFVVTASAGVAVYPEDGEDSETLVRNADIAMYIAKNKGKNQYKMCTSEMKSDVQLSLELSNDLVKALDNDEFVVYYQPQIELETHHIVGVEALLRWMHPTKGMISPAIFIPLAEKMNLIQSIDKWVLKTACLQNKKWQDMGLPHINIAVNLSIAQMINPAISRSIEKILKETELDPKYVELEITESVIKETNYAMHVLNKLKKLGVSIAIDDFETEYSSLSRLKLLPVDRIKIDMHFVQGIDTNDKDKAITRTIIDMAESLGLEVLAEGVETATQLEFLRKENCKYVQGYYFYRPKTVEAMEELLINISKTSSKKHTPLKELNPVKQS